MNNRVIKKLSPLSETKYLSLYEAQYFNKLGKEKQWIIASRKPYNAISEQFFNGKQETIDAVIIAALHTESKKLVLINQFRVPLNDYVYELPAGLIDNNESIELSVKRELMEETGLNLVKINYEKSREKVYISPGMTDESIAMIYCTCNGTISKEYQEEDEDIDIIMVSQQEAKELLAKDIKMDIKAFITLNNFVNLGIDLF
jgi:ADP-ribose pyrophosphatase